MITTCVPRRASGIGVWSRAPREVEGDQPAGAVVAHGDVVPIFMPGLVGAALGSRVHCAVRVLQALLAVQASSTAQMSKALA